MEEAGLATIRKKIQAEGLPLLDELNAVLQSHGHGINAHIHSFFVSTQSVAQTTAGSMKCGMCCWSVGPSTMGCGLCCDF